MDTTPIAPTNPTNQTSVLGTQQAEFGQNQFLDLLIAQLRTQTPTDPVDNQAFVEQLATFTSLQEQQELNDGLLQLLDFQGSLARIQGLGEGSALLGKEVEFATDAGSVDRGVVDSVSIGEDGIVRLQIGGRSVELTRVVGISEPGTTGAGSDAADGSSGAQDGDASGDAASGGDSDSTDQD